MNNKMVVSIGIDIAKGIYHLHKENILHCDLVARNLLVIQVINKHIFYKRLCIF
jgi:tRNA A-37 threonylcarbamoyl transferase component Bud32